MTIFSNNYLHGNTAFFNTPAYKEGLKKEFNTSSSCIYQSSQKIEKTSQLSTIGYIACRSMKMIFCPQIKRPNLLGTTLAAQTTDWKYKRITILLDGESIDATIMVRPSTSDNKKWVLTSVGRAQRYEDKLTDKAFQTFLKDINSNAIFFNYSKMGASTGKRNPKNMVAAYKAVLDFLEDDQKGIGAKQIIGYGYSIGGGVQGESLKTHNLALGLQKGIKYVFIKDRTFSELKDVAKSWTKGLLGWLLPRYEWNLESTESSKKLGALKIPEIIIQSTDDTLNPVSDGVISKNASLKKKISTLPEDSKKYKWYINIKKQGHKNLHIECMSCFSKQLSEKVNELTAEETKEEKTGNFWDFFQLSFS